MADSDELPSSDLGYKEYDLMDNSGYIFDVWTAASVGDLEYVRDIIDDDIDEVNRGGWTCLMYASYYDHAQLVAFLLSSGSDAHAGKRTALMLAAACGHTDIIDVLVRVGGVGQDLDRDSKGFTALCHAVSSGHMDACHALLDAGSNVNVSVRSDLNALTPLLLAAQDGHERIVELLLRYGADPGYTATSGDNAISLALKQGHERIARFVKAKKATKVCPGVWDGPAQAEQLMSMKKKPAAFPHDLPTLLRDLKLDKYQENFQNVTLEIFLEMSDDDLKTLGISLLGPRRKLTAAIEHWDSKYVLENKSFEEMGDVGEVWFGENAMLRMVRWLESHVSPDSSIIDLGCGNGLLSIELFEAGFKDVTGVDYSESAIQLANKVAEQRDIFGINFTICDILSSNITAMENRFDVCLDKGTYDGISLHKKNSKEMRASYRQNVIKMLKVNGVFFITSCNWTEEELESYFSANFKVRTILPTPTFQFGGTTGKNVTAIVFEKV